MKSLAWSLLAEIGGCIFLGVAPHAEAPVVGRPGTDSLITFASALTRITTYARGESLRPRKATAPSGPALPARQKPYQLGRGSSNPSGSICSVTCSMPNRSCN
jgi:hypothetical protein